MIHMKNLQNFTWKRVPGKRSRLGLFFDGRSPVSSPEDEFAKTEL